MFVNTAQSIESDFLPRFFSVDQHATHRQAAESERLTAAALSAPLHGSSSVLHPSSGVAELMRAVLEDAIYCFNLGAGKTPKTRRLVQEARVWFGSNDERWPFAFINVCRALGLDPASVRRTLRHGNARATSAPPRKRRMEASRRRPLRYSA